MHCAGGSRGAGRDSGTAHKDLHVVGVSLPHAFEIERELVFSMAVIEEDIAICPHGSGFRDGIGVGRAAVVGNVEGVVVIIAGGVSDDPQVLYLAIHHRPLAVFSGVVKGANVGKMIQHLRGGEEHVSAPFTLFIICAVGADFPRIGGFRKKSGQHACGVLHRHFHIDAVIQFLVSHSVREWGTSAGSPGKGRDGVLSLGCQISRDTARGDGDGNVVDGGRRVGAGIIVVVPQDVEPLRTRVGGIHCETFVHPLLGQVQILPDLCEGNGSIVDVENRRCRCI